MASIYRQRIKRRLATGEERQYVSNAWHCRFYANGQVYRYSTGLDDAAAAQARAAEWERQSKAGEVLTPQPPGIGRPRLTKAPVLQDVALVSTTPLASHSARPLVDYIQVRRQLGRRADEILDDVLLYLTSSH